MINKIEQGQSFPKREIRERLIERLGESAYDYENYVEAKDYKEWKLETALLDALNSAEISKAQQLEIDSPIVSLVCNKSITFSLLPGASQCGTNRPSTKPRQSTPIKG